jgi:hypothetical protein
MRCVIDEGKEEGRYRGTGEVGFSTGFEERSKSSRIVEPKGKGEKKK